MSPASNFESATTTSLMSSAGCACMMCARCATTSPRLSAPKTELNLLTDAKHQQRRREKKDKKLY